MPFGLYNLIYTLLSTDLLEKLIVPQPVEEIPQILWNLNVHYCIHNRTPLVLILSHMNPAHTLLFVYDSLMPWSSTWFISFRFFYQNIICTSFLPTRAICPTHLIVLHLIAQWYLVRTIHKVPHFASLSSLLLLPPSSIQNSKHKRCSTICLKNYLCYNGEARNARDTVVFPRFVYWYVFKSAEK